MVLTFKLFFLLSCSFHNIPLRLDVGTSHCGTLGNPCRHSAEHWVNQDPVTHPHFTSQHAVWWEHLVYIIHKLINAHRFIFKFSYIS